MTYSKTQNIGRWIALIFGILLYAFFAMFGIGELFGDEGDLPTRLMYAFSHIVIQGLPVLLVTWLAWKKPFWGGIAFLLLTLGAVMMFGLPPENEVIWTIDIMLPLIGILLLSGGPARRLGRA